jgi:hypothetical protein
LRIDWNVIKLDDVVDITRMSNKPKAKINYTNVPRKNCPIKSGVSMKQNYVIVDYHQGLWGRVTGLRVSRPCIRSGRGVLSSSEGLGNDSVLDGFEGLGLDLEGDPPAASAAGPTNELSGRPDH